MVIKDAPHSYHKRVKGIMPLLDNLRDTKEYTQLEILRLNIEPCFLILTSREVSNHPSIMLDISYEGIILYDEDDFLQRHLEQIRNTLKRLGSFRKMTSHGHYWILKSDIKPGEVIDI